MVETLDWLGYELSELSLGDKRLNWRAVETGRKLARMPEGSIPKACEDWADTKASYRLFANEKTTAEKLLEPHYQRTGQRASSYKRVLAIQDTSYLNYTHHPKKEGLGPIGSYGKNGLSGLVMHSSLIINDEGLPLGLASQEIWARDEQTQKMKPEERRKLPIEEKESYKWLKAVNQTLKVIPHQSQVINVGDCVR